MPSTSTPKASTDDALKKAGIPPEPTGAKRAELLEAIRRVAPDAVRHEDKAIDAARNQCGSLDSAKADWLASQRFTYKDVTTDEAQGAGINGALKKSGFCNT
ncbi:hypothetical protein ABZO31_00450 [Streptomyces sp. HUAS MG47]|uniref:hypothetical protein n=1 Tax=Streptomyces solicamelliae TaxID=3231716 RepID=UPI003877CA53